jgi:YHS domain-containing protein
MDSTYGCKAMNSRILLASLALLISIALLGCSTTHATYKNSSGDEVMLLGFDPVAYFTEGVPTIGSRLTKAKHEGRTYHFVNAANREQFLANPARFEPQYGGFCANGAAYGMKWASNPTSFEIIDQRLFIFSGWGSHASWILDKTVNIKHADHLWQTEMRDAGWRWQSVKRMTFRVAHYQSNDALNAQWDKQFPQKPKPASQNGGFWSNFTRPPGWQAAEGLGQAPVGWPD